MADGLRQLTNASNVQCYLVHADRSVPPSVAFFIDPLQRVTKLIVASCKDGTVSGSPLVVNLTLTCLTPNLTVEQTRDRLIEEAANQPASGDRALSWTMENKLLRINVNLSTLQQLTASAAPSEMVKMPTKPMPMTKAFTAAVAVSAPGQTDWGFLPTPQHPSEESGVSRRLQLGSVSPEPDPGSRSASEPTAAERPPIEVDTADAPLVRFIFFPQRWQTNTFNLKTAVFNEIGVDMTIRTLERRTTRERKHPRGTPARNVVLEETTLRGEPVLIVSFRADKDFGPIDLCALTQVDFGNTHDRSGERQSHLVADAQNITLGRHTVTFTVTRVQLPLPTEKEVYVVVRTFLEPQADNLDDMVMDDVRDYVFNTFKELNRILLSQRQELNQLTWSCTRLFVLNTLVEQKEDPADDVDDIILSAINRQGGGYEEDDPYDEL